MGKDFTKDFEIIYIDSGDEVNCDLCNKSFKGLSDSGGFIFLSTAICPDCAGAYLAGIDKYNEREYIKAICKPDISFYDFVIKYREENY